MLNGHLDTATLASDVGDPSRSQIKNGRLYGPGAADAKGGVAASLVALTQAKQDRLDGDIIFTGVAGLGIGTEQLLQAGWRADDAIVSSPTHGSLGIAHKGFAWFEVTIHGRASPGFRFDTGIDAISRAGYFLVALDKYSQRLIEEGPKHPSLGPGSVHASIVKGGKDLRSYPATSSIQLERQTVLDEPRRPAQGRCRRTPENLYPRFPCPFLRIQDHPLAPNLRNRTGSPFRLSSGRPN